MPGASHCVADNQSIRQRRAVVGAGGADRKDLSAGACQQNGLFADMAGEHASLGQVARRDALRQVRTGWCRLRRAHGDLLLATPNPDRIAA
jgi:phage tail tape-measure protein